MIPNRWLPEIDYATARAHIPTDLPPLPCPPDDEHIPGLPIVDNGNPLEELPDDIPSRHAYAELGSQVMPSRMFSRRAVIHKLRQAQQLLPEGVGLQVLDTWRSVPAQREISRIYRAIIPDLTSEYVAAADDPDFPAPHTTGGAVDLTLTVGGTAYGLGSDFDEFSTRSNFHYYENLDSGASTAEILARDARRLLAHTLLSVGFAPIRSEWWHFSYGDQRWAVYSGSKNAIFNTVTPG